MKPALLFLLCLMASGVRAQSAEQRIRNYLAGYEQKNWKMTADQFAQGFSFSSPAGDDHISLETYHQKCWPTAGFVQKVTFSHVMVKGNTAFAIYNIATTDHKTVRNTEYYTFSGGKIKSIECFFGTGIGYPGNNKQK